MPLTNQMNNNTRLPSLAATAAPPNDRENVLSAYARRSQDRPVTVLHYPLVEVVLLCGTTLSYNVFSTVDEIYDLAWQRLCYLQGPAWDTNSFRVNVVFQNRILLNRCVGLCEYGIRDGDTICVYVTGNCLVEQAIPVCITKVSITQVLRIRGVRERRHASVNLIPLLIGPMST